MANSTSPCTDKAAASGNFSLKNASIATHGMCWKLRHTHDGFLIGSKLTSFDDDDDIDDGSYDPPDLKTLLELRHVRRYADSAIPDSRPRHSSSAFNLKECHASSPSYHPNSSANPLTSRPLLSATVRPNAPNKSRHRASASRFANCHADLPQASCREAGLLISQRDYTSCACFLLKCGVG